ncbi:uncharacterized protein LOC117787573 isoform X2 [Drosophila innubila]|uniref:uncharacterized protein LOC117787573 isoform X2 n=1 Tax=Drosophila innubila TaxID=198719 RepID=UPI00148E840B|nr:uncharacterized protein LOC117787573 isoform X2 [Drosophila innubila]
MSIMRIKGIIESQKGEDLTKLRMVVSKLDDHLKDTNEKLANLRHKIKMEANPNLRETFLKKSHTMVWEQQTIRRILEDYKRKLNVMVFDDASKKYDKKQRQVSARNDKLFELFESNDLGPEKAIPKDDNANLEKKAEETESADEFEDSKSSEDQETGKLKFVDKTEDVKDTQNHVKKRKTSEDISGIATEVTEDIAPRQIAINTPAEALIHLAALQEYAMMNDNFRASGLLIQVEKAFQNPPNSNDFEL